MNIEDAKRLMAEGPEAFNKLPWDTPAFIFVPGRYYVGMWFLKMTPKLAGNELGGDTTLMLWRFDHEPDTWTLTFRFRYYASKDPWAKGDRRNWNVARDHNASEQQAFEKTNQLLKFMAEGGTVISGGDVIRVDYFDIRGDAAKAMKLIQEKKPFWLHAKNAKDVEGMGK